MKSAAFTHSYRQGITGLPTNLNELAKSIHRDNILAGWWKQERVMPEGTPIWAMILDDFGLRRAQRLVTVPRNIGELLCLIHSEIDEAAEGMTDCLMDDKLTHRTMFEVELGDTAIRALDMLGYFEFNIDHCFAQPSEIPRGNDAADWLSLMHRIVSRSMEGFRKGNDYRGCAELTQLLQVLHDCSITFGLDLSGAIAEKRDFNRNRADHKLANRTAAGGKRF